MWQHCLRLVRRSSLALRWRVFMMPAGSVVCRLRTCTTARDSRVGLLELPGTTEMSQRRSGKVFACSAATSTCAETCPNFALSRLSDVRRPILGRLALLYQHKPACPGLERLQRNFRGFVTLPGGLVPGEWIGYGDKNVVKPQIEPEKKKERVNQKWQLS